MRRRIFSPYTKRYPRKRILFRVKTVFNESDKKFPSLRGVHKRYMSRQNLKSTSKTAENTFNAKKDFFAVYKKVHKKKSFKQKMRYTLFFLFVLS